MTVGGVPTSVAAGFAVFWPVRGAVAEYQHARSRRVRRKMQAAALAESESEGS